MDIYNRFANSDAICNAYITCTLTEKVAVAIDGTTLHTILKISLSKLLPLSIEVGYQCHTLFKYVKILIINERMDMILTGDFLQLPPVRAIPIYKRVKQSMVKPLLRQGFKFYQLNRMMSS